MTYWINVWQSSQPRIGTEPAIQYWATEIEAIEEITDGPIGFYYDETIQRDDQGATVIDLKTPARKHDPKARRVNMRVETEAPE
jgi:hypothetical protein